MHNSIRFPFRHTQTKELSSNGDVPALENVRKRRKLKDDQELHQQKEEKGERAWEGQTPPPPPLGHYVLSHDPLAALVMVKMMTVLKKMP